jgi:hypothetical protein
MPSKDMQTFAGLHVPYSHVAVAATGDKYVVPWDHSPYAHDMTFQSLLVVADRIEDVDFGIVHRNHDILVSQMEACNDTLIRSDVLDDAFATFPPRCLDHVLMPEMRIMRL